MESRSLRMSSSRSPFAPSQSVMRSRTRRSSPRKFCSTSRKSVGRSRAICTNCWKRSLSAVSSRQREVAGAHALDCGVDLVAPFAELRDARFGVRLGALAHLSQQIEEREQPRLGAHEAAIGQRGEPGYRFLGGRSEVEMRLVGIGRIELAQPPPLRARPIIEVVNRRPGKCVRPQPLPQREQLVFQRLGQVTLRQRSLVGRDEHPLQEARHQRCVVRAQQPPSGVVRSEMLEGVVVEIHRAIRRM